MSDKIELGAQTSGVDAIERLVSAVESLTAAMAGLASTNSPLAQLQAQMANGFTELAELTKGGGERVARQLTENGDKAAAAVEAAGRKIKEADARTWQQIQNGSATNVEKAFNQIAQGIPVEAVRAKMGEMATSVAASMNGSLEEMKQFAANSESLWETHYSRLAGATEAQMLQALEMDKAFDAKRLAQAQGAALKLSEASAAASWQNHIDLDNRRIAAEEALAARVNALNEASAAASWRNYLELEAKKEAADTARYQHQNQLDEASAAASWRNFLDLEAKKASSIESQRVLNTSYITAGPASQVRTATQAQVYAGLGGDAAARYGSEAAAADALAAAELRLALASKTSGAAAVESAAGHEILNGVMKDATGVFKGAAHEAGIYGLAHGQLIALLAGGALAAALHHIASTGAEVEYEMANLNALSDKMNQQPMDLDKFIGITSGTLTSLKDAAGGVAALAEAGFNQQRALAVLPDIMRLASLGNMSVAQSAEMAVESMHAFGKTDADIGSIGDVLVAVGAKANVSVHKLAEDMKSAATTGQLFNLSMQEITATVGALAERGLTIQPLSSALNKLYEPSAKTAAAMKEFGLTVKDGEGNLKNYTQFMGELQAKVNEFKVPADALKQLGMSAQSIKAMEVMTQHWSDYKHLLDEANDSQGKMFDAMVVKEDTVEGAYKRLASTVEGSLTRAFIEASPVIRQVEEDLMRTAGSKGFIDMLSSLAVGVARLTELVVDHAKGIALMVAGYASLRILATAISAVQGLAIAYEASTAALLIKQKAEEAEMVRLAALTIEERAAAMAAKELAAGSLLAGEGMTAAAAGARTLTSAMGVIGLVVTAATVAYELFRDKLDEQEKQRIAAINTTDTTIDAYGREIERLKGVEEQLIRTGKAGKEAADMIAILHAQDRVSQAEEKMKAAADAPVGPGQLGLPGRFGTSARNGQELHNQAEEAANKELVAATENLAKLQAVQQEAEVRASNVEALMSAKEARDKLHSMPDSVTSFVNTGAARAAAADANTRLANLRAETITEQNLVEVKKQLAIIEKDISATKRDAAPISKPDKSILAAGLSELQQKIDLEKMDSKMELNSLTQQNKRAEIGDLVLINAKLQEKIDLSNQVIRLAKEQYDLVSASDKVNKANALQKYTGVQNKAEKQKEVDTAAAYEERQNLEDKMNQEDLKSQAVVLAQKGQLVQAFLVDYEVKYRGMIEKTTNDMLNSDDASFKASAQRRLDYYRDIQDSGVDAARFKEDKQSFDTSLAAIQNAMADAKAKAAADGGLSGALGVAAAADEVRRNLLPALQAASNQLTLDASKPGTAPALVVEASKASTSLSGVTKQLAKDAQPFGDAWTKVWKDVDGAAHSAWMSIGTGGANAFDQIGKVLKTSILDALYQLTVKKWLVNIGASVSGGAGGLMDAAGSLIGLNGSAPAAGSSALSLIGTGASAISAGSTLSGLASGTGVISQFAGGLSGSAAAASEALGGAELTTAAAAGDAIGSAATAIASAIPVWGWAALGAVALYSYFGDKGPEDHTRLGFTSNNTPGNISINERGNEGKSNTYIDPGVSSAFGTFGVNSSFWMSSSSKTVVDFQNTVAKVDDSLAQFLTTSEKANVSSYLTGKQYTSNSGHEGTDPNAEGGLDNVFKARIHDIMEGVQSGLSKTTDSFKGTSQELSVEASKILQFRQALVDGGAAVFGMKVALEDIVALKQPTENTSDALVRVTSVFNTTNQIASLTGKSAEQMFGAIGLSSFQARSNLIQAAGGLTNLSAQVNSYSANFLTKTQQTSLASQQVTKTMADLGLSSITTKEAFAKVVSGIDATTPAGAKLFASLMGVQQAFSDVKTASEGVTKGLQDQLDQLTMTRVELLDKERAALDPANQALYDQIQVQKKLADAKTAVSAAYDTEVNSITSANTRLASLGTTLRTFVAGLATGSNSPFTPIQKYAIARNDYEMTLNKAKAGDTAAQDSLQTKASTFLDTSRVANASGAAYTADFQRVATTLSGMADWADNQVDVGKASLEQLRQQVGALVDIKAAVLTLPQALAALQSQQSGRPDQLQRNIANDAYTQLIGHLPDQKTLDALAAALTGGESVAAMVSGIKNSPDYATSHTASSYDYTSGTTSAVFQSMADELRAVREQLVAAQDQAKRATEALIAAAFASTDAAAQKAAQAAMDAAQQAAFDARNTVNIA